MRLAVRKGLFRGVKANRNGPVVSHLLFADDCIIFGEATMNGVKVIKEILKEYELNYGQCTNFEKSTVFFSANTNLRIRLQVAHGLGVRVSSNSEKYLGLPNMMG